VTNPPLPNIGESTDPAVRALVASRDTATILKLKLMTFRSTRPNVPICVFEGPDDKIAYYQWIRRIKPNFQYEPLPCAGKKNVLSLRSMLHADLDNLRANVYYFIDRDFEYVDEIPANDDLFITETYSIENVVVSKEVLGNLLTNEFHCHTEPEVRTAILTAFDNVYNRFLETTKILNSKLFATKQHGLRIIAKPADQIGQIARVELNDVRACLPPAEDGIVCLPILTQEHITEISPQFEALEPRTRYRGKFALLFFKRWIELLAADYRETGGGIFFRAIERRSNVMSAEFTLGSFAAKSALPNGLDVFIQRIAN